MVTGIHWARFASPKRLERALLIHWFHVYKYIYTWIHRRWRYAHWRCRDLEAETLKVSFSFFPSCWVDLELVYQRISKISILFMSCFPCFSSLKSSTCKHVSSTRNVKCMPGSHCWGPYMPTPQLVFGLEGIVRLACGDSPGGLSWLRRGLVWDDSYRWPEPRVGLDIAVRSFDEKGWEGFSRIFRELQDVGLLAWSAQVAVSEDHDMRLTGWHPRWQDLPQCVDFIEQSWS